MRLILAALALTALVSAIGAFLYGKPLAALGFLFALWGLCYLLVTAIVRKEKERQ